MKRGSLCRITRGPHAGKVCKVLQLNGSSVKIDLDGVPAWIARSALEVV